MISESHRRLLLKTKLSVREISLIRALLGLTKIRASIPSESLNGELIEEYIEKISYIIWMRVKVYHMI